MNIEKLLAHFAKKLQTKVETDGIQITRSTFGDIKYYFCGVSFRWRWNTKAYEHTKKYVKDIPEKIKKEVSIHTSEFVTASAIKNVTNFQNIRSIFSSELQ